MGDINVYYVEETKMWKVYSPLRITDEVLERVRAASFDIFIDGHCETNALIICRKQSSDIEKRTEDIRKCFQ